MFIGMSYEEIKAQLIELDVDFEYDNGCFLVGVKNDDHYLVYMDDKTKSVCVESYWMYVDKSFFLFS
jgi:hypothetical protein